MSVVRFLLNCEKIMSFFYICFQTALGGKKGKLGKLGPVAEKKVIPVESDPKKLVNFVCGSNIYTKGEDAKVTIKIGKLKVKVNNFFVCR